MTLGLDPDDPRPLVLRGDSAVSRGEIRSRSDALCAVLHEHGTRRVLLHSDDVEQLLTAIDACSRCGADLWLAPTALATDNLERLCARFDIDHLITDGGTTHRHGSAAQEGTGCVHLMTSGTTGEPKIVAHTLASLLGRIETAARLPTNRDSRWLLTYQPTAFAGIQVILTAVKACGALLLPNERTPWGFVEAALRQGATHISGTPTFWRSFLFAMPLGSMASLRQITLGGEAVDQRTLDRLQDTFPAARITHIYASTEAGAVFAVHDGREGFPAEWLTSGVGGVVLRVIDGGLELISPRGMQHYASNTAQPYTDDGWLRTGDLVSVNSDRVHFLGRRDDVINVGGAKINPQVVESFLLSLDGVREARVRGVANPITGMIVGAEVVLSAGIDTAEVRQRIVSACYAALPAHEVPRKIAIVNHVKVQESGKKG